MTPNEPRGAPAAGAPLRERWRERSVASTWRRASDWRHPAVDGLVAAVLAGEGGEAAALRLGAARCAAGVGIAEAIDDLGAFYQCVDGGPPPTPMLRALCEGWTDEQASGIALGSCLDPSSGLPTRDYLATRLVETYAVCRRAGASPAQSHRLLVLDSASPSATPWSRLARSATVGAALRDQFGDVHPMASLGGDVFVVLVDETALDEEPSDDPDGPTALDRVVTRTLAHVARHALQLDVPELVRHPPRVRLEGLPAVYEDAERLLVDLTR